MTTEMIDAVGMMRSIRDGLSETYFAKPEEQESELRIIREEFQTREEGITEGSQGKKTSAKPIPGNNPK